MINEKVEEILLNCENEEEKLIKEYTKKLEKELVGKKFRINDIICFHNDCYEYGDIVVISSISFDGYEILFKDKYGNRFTYFDFDYVEFVDVD